MGWVLCLPRRAQQAARAWAPGLMIVAHTGRRPETSGGLPYFAAAAPSSSGSFLPGSTRLRMMPTSVDVAMPGSV
jgi:hypothetical protein